MARGRKKKTEAPEEPVRKRRRITLGMRFAPWDLYCMREACKASVRFMQTYGQGSQPVWQAEADEYNALLGERPRQETITKDKKDKKK